MLLSRLLLPLVAVLALVGCADDAADESPGEAQPTEAETAPAPPAATEEPADDVEDQATDTDAQGATMTDAASGVTVEGALDEKPSITLPGGEPPSGLQIVDVVEGDGDEVPEGATVTTHYVGVSWLNDGGEFDASWNRGAPLTFPLSGVISGWTEGIPGMRVGGRRLLVIPPEQGYGAQSPTPAIAPNDTLVFVIDLVDFE